MDPLDIIRILRDIKKAITRIGQASGAIQEALDDLAASIDDLERLFDRGMANARHSVAPKSLMPLPVAKLILALARILPEPASPRQSHRWQEDVSVSTVQLKPHPGGGGSVVVSIDAKKLVVPPALGDLISELIADDGGPSPDDLIPFKTLSNLSAKLEGQRQESRLSRSHALNQWIHRLRRLLHEHGFSRHLVQTRRGTGARFALKRRGPGQNGQNPQEPASHGPWQEPSEK